MSAFKDLLLPIENFSFQSLGTSRLIDKNQNFRLFMTAPGKWKILFSKTLHQSSETYSSWIKARDQAIEILKQQDIDTSGCLPMHVESPPIYRIINQTKISRLYLSKQHNLHLNSSWTILDDMTPFSDDYYPLLETFLIQKFKTRKQLLQSLYDIVSDNLYQLYTIQQTQTITYTSYREYLLNNPTKTIIGCWWMSFVPLRLDLDQVFSK